MTVVLLAVSLRVPAGAHAQRTHEWILWDEPEASPGNADGEGDADEEDDGAVEDWGLPAPSFNGTSTTIVEWHADNRNGDDTDDDYGDALSRTQLMLDGDGWRGSLRIDGIVFRDAPDGADRRDDLRIERVAFGVDQNVGGLHVSAEAGDFYAQLGHGLVLSLRQVDELGLDVALRGGQVEVALPDDAWRLTLMGGVTNSVNLEMQRLHHVADPDDVVAGARAEGTLGATTVGFHGAGVRTREASRLGHDHTASFGGSVDTIVGETTVGLEVDGQTRQRSGLHDQGWAAYATVTAPLSDSVFLLLEGKHYRAFDVMRGSTSTGDHLDFAYSLPPTAEPEDQELLDDTDITGGRVQIDAAVPWGDSSADLSVGLAHDRRFEQMFAHAVGSLERRWESGASAEIGAGYRREWHDGSGELARAILVGTADVTLPIAGAWSVHASVREETHSEAVGQARHVFHRGTTTLELQSGEELAVAGGFEWDTQVDVPGIADTFGFGLIRWRASDVLTLQALAGTQRGGVKCLAGVCRLAPPFAGARVDASLRF